MKRYDPKSAENYIDLSKIWAQHLLKKKKKKRLSLSPRRRYRAEKIFHIFFFETPKNCFYNLLKRPKTYEKTGAKVKTKSVERLQMTFSFLEKNSFTFFEIFVLIVFQFSKKIWKCMIPRVQKIMFICPKYEHCIY